MSGTVDSHRADGAVLWLLDNPRKNNALDPAMLEELANLCGQAEQDRTIRSVIISGKGDKAFCAGADISAWGSMDPVDFMRIWIGRGHFLLDRIAQLPVPVVGALNGFAFGGGLELAAVCDVRVASPGATFALPETSIGVTPGWSGAQRLARLMPQALVREMALTGGRLDAQRLWSVGFLSEIAESPLERAIAIASRIADLSPRAVDATKLVLSAATGESREQAIDRLASGLAAATPDKAEGVASFSEKRKPRFSGE
jgi:enoyl-CoA hydratase